MYFTQLPDHSIPGFDEQAHFDRFKKQNMIFNAFSRQSHCPNHVGCLSIKTALAGEEPLPVTIVVAALPALFFGPVDRALDDIPPDTSPLPPVAVPAPVRI